MTFEEFIQIAREKGASDIHLTVGSDTVFRINGTLVKFPDLSDQVVNRTILAMLSAEQEEMLNKGEDIDFVFELSTGERQRVNVFRQMGKLAASIRLLNSKIKTLDELDLPASLKTLADRKKGLVLVTGPTGSGKTTTLSAMVDYINRNRACHIITVEDPVEYRYTPKMATIHQREIGRDVKSFSAALRSALREDPDIIYVGEMRDYETIQLAVTAAETGHLVLATLHTKGAAQTINRIIDACPANIQAQMVAQLSQCMEGVISQVLVPTADGKGRVAALEVMVCNDAIKNMIRANKIHQIDSTMQQHTKNGMILMDDYLASLYNQHKITRHCTLEFCNNSSYIATKMM